MVTTQTQARPTPNAICKVPNQNIDALIQLISLLMNLSASQSEAVAQCAPPCPR